jgi:putative peptidoglycan lipid II flippase
VGAAHSGTIAVDLGLLAFRKAENSSPSSMIGKALSGSAASLLQRFLRHPVIRATAGFAAMTALVKAVAFVKEAVVAAAFGVGSSMDSYLMAFVIIGFPSTVLVSAAHTVFTREYVRIIAVDGEAAAARFLRGAFLRLLIALTVLLAVWIALLPAILSVVGYGLAMPQRSLVASNVLRLIPYYYLTSINLLGYGVLQARNAFARSAFIPIVTPLVMIGLIGVLRPDLDVLIGALTAGTAAETLLMLFMVRKEQPRVSDGPTQTSTSLRDLAWGTLILVPGTLVSGLSPVIEQTIASGLGHGTISALGYAAKLPATLNTLLTTAIGVTILPYFSQRLARGDDQNCRLFFVRYAIFVTLAGVSIAAAAVVGSEPFVRFAFQRGQFSAHDTLLVTVLQQAYLWQLPGAMLAAVALRYVAAQGRYRTMTIGSMAMVPVTGLLQWTLSQLWGAPGLAFGTSAGTALIAVVFFRIALRRPAKPIRTLETA